MKIKGCNIRTQQGRYTIWLNPTDDNRVHARIRRTIFFLDREDWWIDETFNDEEAALQKCFEAIQKNSGNIERSSKILEVSIHES